MSTVHERRDTAPDTPDRLLERDARQIAARDRLRQQHHRLRNARMADEVMPLAIHYGPRTLRPVPLAELLGRRAA
jgi:hypothetical protein